MHIANISLEFPILICTYFIVCCTYVCEGVELSLTRFNCFVLSTENLIGLVKLLILTFS